jgi:hypothetical protein
MTQIIHEPTILEQQIASLRAERDRLIVHATERFKEWQAAAGTLAQEPAKDKPAYPTRVQLEMAQASIQMNQTCRFLYQCTERLTVLSEHILELTQELESRPPVQEQE